MQPLPVQAAIRAFARLKTYPPISNQEQERQAGAGRGHDSSFLCCSCLLLLVPGSWLFLSFNPIPIVATDGSEVAEPARLLLLGRIHTVMSCTHLIEKVPNLRDYVSANLLPLIIAHNGPGPGADS